MDLTLRDLIKMDFINSSTLSRVNDDVDLDEIDLVWDTSSETGSDDISVGAGGI